MNPHAYDFLILMEWATTCEDPRQTFKQEIVQFCWVVFDMQSAKAIDYKIIYVGPEWNANPNPLPHTVDGLGTRVAYGANLKEALAQFDEYLYSSFTSCNKTFCLIHDGPCDFRHPLVSEIARKCIPVASHYRIYFDLQEEFLKCFPDIQRLLDRKSMAAYLGLAPNEDVDPPLCDCFLSGQIVSCLISAGHVFRTPRVMPEDELRHLMMKMPAYVYPVSMAVPVGGVLRLRGLPWTCTEEDLRNFFRGIAIVPGGIHLVHNQYGKLTGEAYVQTANSEASEAALRRHKQMIGHRYIEVFLSSPQEMANALSKVDGKHIPGHPGGSGQWRGASSNGSHYVVKLRGLPFSATIDDVMRFLDGIQPSGSGISIIAGSDGRPTGEAFVELPSEAMFNKALELDRSKMGNRYIEVFRSSKTDLVNASERYRNPRSFV